MCPILGKFLRIFWGKKKWGGLSICDKFLLTIKTIINSILLSKSNEGGGPVCVFQKGLFRNLEIRYFKNGYF